MKFSKVAAIVLVVALSASVFAGCTARNNNNGTAASLPAITDAVPSVPPVIEGDMTPEGGTDAFQSEPEYGESGLEGDYIFDSSDIERDTSRPQISSIDPRDDVSGEEDVSVAAMSADFSQIGALSAQKETGFPGGPVDKDNRPGGPVAYQEKYKQYGAYFIVPDSKKIYLTFDEGYENGYTSRILDTLKEKNVKAVFFITYPYAKSEPELVKRMIAEGHTLGNHSTKHFVYPDVPLTEAAADLMNLHEYVRSNFGYTMSLFRPPEGAFSEQTLALAQALGYNTMLWSFAYKDYDVQNQPIAIEALDNIVKKAHPGEICLLHAVSRTNAEILGDAIDLIKAKGFVFADYFYFR